MYDAEFLSSIPLPPSPLPEPVSNSREQSPLAPASESDTESLISILSSSTNSSCLIVPAIVCLPQTMLSEISMMNKPPSPLSPPRQDMQGHHAAQRRIGDRREVEGDRQVNQGQHSGTHSVPLVICVDSNSSNDSSDSEQSSTESTQDENEDNEAACARIPTPASPRPVNLSLRGQNSDAISLASIGPPSHHLDQIMLPPVSVVQRPHRSANTSSRSRPQNSNGNDGRGYNSRRHSVRRSARRTASKYDVSSDRESVRRSRSRKRHRSPSKESRQRRSRSTRDKHHDHYNRRRRSPTYASRGRHWSREVSVHRAVGRSRYQPRYNDYGNYRRNYYYESRSTYARSREETDNYGDLRRFRRLLKELHNIATDWAS